MSFSRPDLLGLAVVLPAVFALLVWAYARRRARVARVLGEAALLRRLGGGDLQRFPLARLLLLCLAAGALGLAAAGPRWGQRATDEHASALNVVVALDISKSMLATDVTPNRLERSRLFARRLLRAMPVDRIGLVVFAGRAYVLSPLTTDHSALSLYLDALDPEMVSQGGSSLAAAIAQATDLARGSAEAGGERAVLLISDGEALEDIQGVRAAADRAARAGIRVFTAGVGTAAGSPIPERNDETGQVTGYVRGPGGEVVVSRLDEALLRDVAQRTRGEYVDLERAGSLDAVLSMLRGMERSALEGGRRVEQPERFAIFVAIALILLSVDVLWPHVVAARRSMLAAAVLALLLSTTAFGIGDVERGNRHYRAGRYAEAVAAYQSALRDGNRSAELRYNLGTALLALGRYDEAEPHLRSAIDVVQPDVRQRAYYNLGNRYLEAARANEDPQGQAQLLEAAIDAYKRALRLQPGDPQAKWNLELALRERQEQPQQPQQSGQDEQPQDEDQPQQQGGAGSAGSQSANQQAQREPVPAGGEMTKEQADRILSAVEQDERDLTRQKLRRGQRRTPVARDW